MGEPLKTSELVRMIGANATRRIPKTPEDEANMDRAEYALANIFALKQSPQFKWFEETCIQAIFQKSRESFIAKSVKPESLVAAQKVYHAALEFRVWMIEQEIVNRRVLNPDDSELPILGKQLQDIQK